MTACCRVCGRPLRSRRYAEAGIGPICARKVQATVATEPTAPRPTVDQCPGQTTIPLDTPDTPDAAIAVIQATLTDHHLVHPDTQTDHIRRELTRHGWTITPTA